MNKQDEKQIKLFLKNIGDVSETKIELYWTVAPLIFSKNFFKKRSDLELFVVSVLTMNFANYVYKSRTILLGRIMKAIHNMPLEEAVKINNNLMNFISKNIGVEEKTENTKSKSQGFFSDWEGFLNKKRE